jgi:Tol biopolymer transport system component
MKLEEDKWTPPQVVPFSSKFFDSDDPCFTPDGTKFFFTSWRPEKWFQVTDLSERIWVVERANTGWSKPQLIGEAVNTMDLHWQFSLTRDETLYFASQGDLYRSILVDGEYSIPQKLGEAINTNSREELPFIAPDESYLIFSSNGHPDRVGDYDLFITFRNSDGDWMEVVNLGQNVNSPFQDIYPVVSPDGKYLFFLSNRGGAHNIYWVEFEVLKNDLLKDE